MNDIMPYDAETGELQPVTGPAQSMVGALVRAEIDTQVATAHAYPRSVSRVVKNVNSLVTISEEAAQECNYALPRGGKPITGPSVRLAEIVASQWGNCRVGARVVHVDRIEKFVEAEGIFHDLETNTATTARVRRRITDKNGRLYNDDMITVTGNAACSIAKRNAILGGVPKAVWNEAYQTALRTIKGDVKTLPERRDGAFKAFAAFGVTPEQIVAALDLGGIEDITLEHLATLIAMHKAIKEGEQKVEDYFPALGAKPGATQGKPSTLSEIAEEKRRKSSGKAKQAETKAADKASPEGKAGKEPAKTQEDAADGPGPDNRSEVDMQVQGDGDPDDDDSQADEAEKVQAGYSEPDGAGSEGATDEGQAQADTELVEKAYGRGMRARQRGMREDSIPPDVKHIPALSDAWLRGWNEGGNEDDA